MKRIVVLAFEDRTRAGGGHATLLLLGIERLPEAVRFDLRQIDAAEPTAGAAGRHSKGLEPVAVRLTAEGLEITVGPEVTERPDLTVGMAVEIVVQDLDVKGEFLWPDVTPRARPKRRLLVTKAVVTKAVRAPQPAELPEPANGGGQTAAAGAPSPVSRVTIETPVVTTAPLTDAGQTVPPQAVVDRSMPAIPTLELRPLLPPAAPATQHQAVSEPHPVPPAVGNEPPLGRSWPGFAAMIVAAVLVIEGVAYLGLGGRLPAGFGRLANEATAGAAAPIRSALVAATPSSEIFEMLAPGQRSPSGLDAAGVGEHRALAFAARHLQGAAGERDTAEGAFWLQRYLAGRLADPLVVRALTQLGSTHAEPSRGEPDYLKAHRLWQIAGAYGDPVALCFLATLHDKGLGVPADRAQANRWQAAAMAAGGCGPSGRQPSGADSTRKP